VIPDPLIPIERSLPDDIIMMVIIVWLLVWSMPSDTALDIKYGDPVSMSPGYQFGFEIPL
jgi:hypothetical protein